MSSMAGVDGLEKRKSFDASTIRISCCSVSRYTDYIIPAPFYVCFKKQSKYGSNFLTRINIPLFASRCLTSFYLTPASTG